MERGKQLWPIAEHIDYRLALEAPGPYAGGVLHPEAGRFALGPLTEVAASTHSFAELTDHIQSPQAAGYVAAERVVRGEDLESASGTHPEVLEMTLRLQNWEPPYPLATYRAAEAEFQDPELKLKMMPGDPEPFESLEDDEVRRALVGLVDIWVSQSNGAVNVSIVEGSSEGAISALGFDEFSLSEITASDAFAVMAWAGASGGARGRRRGAAFGRFSAWWAGCALTDLDWPPDPTELGAEIANLKWFSWEPAIGVQGWNLHLAVSSPDRWATAIAATDLIEKE